MFHYFHYHCNCYNRSLVVYISFFTTFKNWPNESLQVTKFVLIICFTRCSSTIFKVTILLTKSLGLKLSGPADQFRLICFIKITDNLRLLAWNTNLIYYQNWYPQYWIIENPKLSDENKFKFSLLLLLFFVSKVFVYSVDKYIDSRWE